MASAMASLTLPSALSAASSRLAQPQQQVQQSMLVVRNSASAERPSSSCSAGKDSALQFTSRRQAALSLAGLSLALLTGSGSRAEASDVPLFGLKRKLEDAEKAVEQAEEAVVAEVKELVQEGEAEVAAVSSAVAGAFKSASASSEDGLSPAVQAGLVAGAELVAVVAASSVVSSLVSQPSK